MLRIEIFNALRNHPMIGRDFHRLNQAEIQWAEKFISDNQELGINAYATKVNRLAVPVAIRKKNRTVVWALLLEAVTLEVRINRATGPKPHKGGHNGR